MITELVTEGPDFCIITATYNIHAQGLQGDAGGGVREGVAGQVRAAQLDRGPGHRRHRLLPELHTRGKHTQ